MKIRRMDAAKAWVARVHHRIGCADTAAAVLRATSCSVIRVGAGGTSTSARREAVWASAWGVSSTSSATVTDSAVTVGKSDIPGCLVVVWRCQGIDGGHPGTCDRPTATGTSSTRVCVGVYARIARRAPVRSGNPWSSRCTGTFADVLLGTLDPAAGADIGDAVRIGGVSLSRSDLGLPLRGVGTRLVDDRANPHMTGKLLPALRSGHPHCSTATSVGRMPPRPHSPTTAGTAPATSPRSIPAACIASWAASQPT